jgi:hypothetical protein
MDHYYSSPLIIYSNIFNRKQLFWFFSIQFYTTNFCLWIWNGITSIMVMQLDILYEDKIIGIGLRIRFPDNRPKKLSDKC